MVAASILPVAIHKGQLYFLFGKENSMEDSAKGFSDFGGGVESGESIMETALREGSEEMSGFLGDSNDIKTMIQKNGGVFPYTHEKFDYHVHVVCIEYDANLPFYYTNHHHFVWTRMNKKVLNDSKFFEKQEIRWFSVNQLKTCRDEFRGFYREIVDEIAKRVPQIRRFFYKNMRRVRANSIAKRVKTLRCKGNSVKGIHKSKAKSKGTQKSKTVRIRGGCGCTSATQRPN